MRALKKLRISEKYFRELPFHEKFNYCISEPERYESLLTNQEQIQYDRIFSIFHLTQKCLSDATAVKIIQQKILGANDWHIAKKLYRDTTNLLTPFVEVNKQAKRIAMSERLLEWAEILEEEGNFIDAAILIEKAAKIGGYDKDDDKGIDWDSFQIPASEYSNDPALLAQEFTTYEGEEESEDD